MDLEDFAKLKKKIEKSKSDIEVQKGIYLSHLERLKKEFDCSTIEEAENLLAKMKEQQEKVQEVLQRKTEELEQLYNDWKQSSENASN